MKEKVTFVATRIKGQKTKLSFYNESGKRLSPDEVRRVPRKNKIVFEVITKK